MKAKNGLKEAKFDILEDKFGLLQVKKASKSPKLVYKKIKSSI